MSSGDAVDRGKKRGMSLVPGGGEDERANWDAWHIPASDDKGHHSRMQIKVPPSFLGMAQDIIASKFNPYKSIGYLYRHALMRHFHWLRENEDFGECVGSTIHAIDAMIDIVRDDEYMEDLRTLFDKLDERVKDHRSRGNDSKAAQLVVKVWAQIRCMNDPFWRGEFEKELKGRYSRMLKEFAPEELEKQ